VAKSIAILEVERLGDENEEEREDAEEERITSSAKSSNYDIRLYHTPRIVGPTAVGGLDLHASPALVGEILVYHCGLPLK
jgi:hypothetical protein